MKYGLGIIVLFLFALPLFANDSDASIELQTAASPAYAQASQMQADFEPSPFSRKNIEWDQKSAKKLLIDAKEGLILFLSGQLTDAKLYLEDKQLPVDNGKFQTHLQLKKDSGSFLFTLENKFGDRTAYKLNYFWLKYPSTQLNILIKDDNVITQKKLDRKGEYDAQEWLTFKWEQVTAPIPALTLFQKIGKVGSFKSVDLAGTFNVQTGGGKLTAFRVAYSPFFDFQPFGARLELGVSPLKNKSSVLFMAVNYQLFGRYTFLEKNTVELGFGGVLFTGEFGGNNPIISFVGRRQLNFLPFQQSLFLGYSRILLTPEISQFQLGTTFTF